MRFYKGCFNSLTPQDIIVARQQMCLSAQPAKSLLLGLASPNIPNLDLYLQEKYFGKLHLTRLIKRVTLRNLEQAMKEIPQHPTDLLCVATTMCTAPSLHTGVVHAGLLKEQRHNKAGLEAM
jgi:hypothetical protein